MLCPTDSFANFNVSSISYAHENKRSSHYYLIGFVALFVAGVFELFRANVQYMFSSKLPSMLPEGILIFSVMLILYYLSLLAETEKEITANQKNLERRAQRDPMTGLYNRKMAENLIRQYIDEEYSDSKAALIILDVDDFKTVNDTYGHPFGDSILIEVADVLQRSFRGSDIIGRLGGDEMMVFMCDIPDNDVAVSKLALTERDLNDCLKNKTEKGEISCSMGCAMYPQDADDFVNLYKCADTALYDAKMRGKGQGVLYDRRIK